MFYQPKKRFAGHIKVLVGPYVAPDLLLNESKKELRDRGRLTFRPLGQPLFEKGKKRKSLSFFGFKR